MFVGCKTKNFFGSGFLGGKTQKSWISLKWGVCGIINGWSLKLLLETSSFLGLGLIWPFHSVSRNVCPHEIHRKNVAWELSSDPKSKVHVSAIFPLHLIQLKSTWGSVLNFIAFLSITTISSGESHFWKKIFLDLIFMNVFPDDSDFFLHFWQYNCNLPMKFWINIVPQLEQNSIQIPSLNSIFLNSHQSLI